MNIANGSEIDTAEDAVISLGGAEVGLFERFPNKKRIKVRLISKSSGKKIDINLNFSHRHTV